MKKRNIIIISIVITAIVFTTVISVVNYNKQYATDKYYFSELNKEPYIEIPGRCKILKHPFSGFHFETDKSVDEVLEFYDNYTKDLKQMTTSVGTGYYIESANLVILKYEATELSNGKTLINIDFDQLFEYVRDTSDESDA